MYVVGGGGLPQKKVGLTMKRIFKIYFSVDSDFYNDVCNKLYDMRKLFNAESNGLFFNSFTFMVPEIDDEERKKLIVFLRDLLKNKEFNFSSCYHVGFIK